MATTSGRFDFRRACALCLGAWIAAVGCGSLALRASAAEGAASSLEAGIPWTAVHAIWFFSNRTEIDRLEEAKFVALAAWVGAHAGSEVGIGLPAGVSDPESAQVGINHGRVSAIRDAMIGVGIPESRIQVGAYDDPLSAVDRRVVLFVRPGPADDLPGPVK